MEIDLKVFLQVIKKFKWIIISIVLFCTILVALISIYIINPVYEAEARLIVTSSKGKIESNSVEQNIQLLKIYKEIISTNTVLEKVEKDHPELNLKVDDLTKKLQISVVTDTPIMKLTVQDSSYQRAVEIVDAITFTFLNELPINLQVKNVSILSKSKIGEKQDPVSPNIFLNILITLFSSLVLTVISLFIKEHLDERISTEDDIKNKLGITCLGVVPKLKRKDKKWLRKKKKGEMDYTTDHE